MRRISHVVSAAALAALLFAPALAGAQSQEIENLTARLEALEKAAKPPVRRK